MKIRKRLLPVAVIVATLTLSVEAATDAERIQMLETQLEQQRQMLEVMDAELKRLKAGQPAEISEVGITATEEQQTVVATVEAPTSDAPDALSATIYGFVMADMIYDFKRVDPNWNDTLRVTTIPTEQGAYGSDGEFVFGVRQSRLGIKGNYGGDITYILEAELFGVAGDEGQTTPRQCRPHLQALPNQAQSESIPWRAHNERRGCVKAEGRALRPAGPPDLPDSPSPDSIHPAWASSHRTRCPCIPSSSCCG